MKNKAEKSLVAAAETECSEWTDEPQHGLSRAEMYHHGDQSLSYYESLKANWIIAIGSVLGFVSEWVCVSMTSKGLNLRCKIETHFCTAGATGLTNSFQVYTLYFICLYIFIFLDFNCTIYVVGWFLVLLMRYVSDSVKFFIF